MSPGAPEIEAVTRGLWAEGKSGTDITIIIMAEFGIELTRNAVMGKLGRMGLLGKKRGPSPCRGVKRDMFSQAWSRLEA